MAEAPLQDLESRKRGFEEQDFEQSKKMKNEVDGLAGADGQELSVRVLCEAKSVGGIIGKGGATIKQLRDESGATIDIADHVAGARKRIVTVKGNVDMVANALHLMADRMQDNKQGNEEDITQDGAPSTEIVLLIPQVQIGGVIGKGGSKISATRESSGANVRISAECLEESSEKTVQIKGASEHVYKALILICYHALENADKACRAPYWPKSEQAAFGFNNPMNPMAAAYGMGGLGQYGGIEAATAAAPYAAAGGFGGYGLAPPAYGGGGGEAPAENVVIPIPESLIGYVIGRRGATINDIRQRSHASIKISDKQPGMQERIVTITGTHQANEMAVALINQKLNQHDMNFGQ